LNAKYFQDTYYPVISLYPILLVEFLYDNMNSIPTAFVPDTTVISNFANANEVLTVDAQTPFNISIKPWKGRDEQRWIVVPHNGNPGVWRLINFVGGRSLAPDQARLADANPNLVGLSDRVWTFVIKPVNGGGFRILTSAEVDQAIGTQRVIAAGSAVGNATATAVITNRANRAVQRDTGNVNLSGVVEARPNTDYEGANAVEPSGKAWSVPAEQIWSFIPFANVPATLQPGTYSIQKALTGSNLILSGTGSVVGGDWRGLEEGNSQWDIAKGANNTWTFRSRAGAREYLQLSDTGADVKCGTTLRVQSGVATNFILQRDGEANQYNILTNAGGILFAVSVPVYGENFILQPAQNVEADYWNFRLLSSN